MQVDVTQDGRNNPALRNAAECFAVFPVLQVPGFQHVTDKPQEPLVMDLLRQNPEKNLMVETAEAVGDVTFNEPCSPGPGVAYLPQCGMAPSPFPEPVRVAGESRLVVRLKEQADHLAH